MLHAIAVHPRQIVADERIRAEVERWWLAEDSDLLVDHLARHHRERVNLCLCSEVVHRDTPCLFFSVVRLVPRAEHQRTHLRRRVHEVLEVWSSEDEGIRGRNELGRNTPSRRSNYSKRSEERRVGKECRSRWSS